MRVWGSRCIWTIRRASVSSGVVLWASKMRSRSVGALGGSKAAALQTLRQRQSDLALLGTVSLQNQMLNLLMVIAPVC